LNEESSERMNEAMENRWNLHLVNCSQKEPAVNEHWKAQKTASSKRAR